MNERETLLVHATVDGMVAAFPSWAAGVVDLLAELVGRAYVDGLCDSYLDEVLPSSPAERAEERARAARSLAKWILTVERE